MSTQPAETLTPDDKPSARPLLSAVTLGRGLAVIRILLGLTYLLNGLAKVFDVRQISFLGFRATLIGREDPAGIMQGQGLESNGGEAPRYR